MLVCIYQDYVMLSTSKNSWRNCCRDSKWKWSPVEVSVLSLTNSWHPCIQLVHGGYASSTLPPTGPCYPQANMRGILYKHHVMDIFPAGDPIPVQRCIVSGFFANAARLHYTGCYRLEWAFTDWLSMLPLFEPHSVMTSLWCLFSPLTEQWGGTTPSTFTPTLSSLSRGLHNGKSYVHNNGGVGM